MNLKAFNALQKRYEVVKDMYERLDVFSERVAIMGKQELRGWHMDEKDRELIVNTCALLENIQDSLYYEAQGMVKK